MKRTLLKSWMFLFCLTCLCSCNDDDNDTETVPQSPNYENPQNWYKLGNDTHFDVDVFYLYPTSWIATEKDGLYCTLDNASLHRDVPNIYESQAKVLEEVANVYVPWYRQFDAAKLLGKPQEAVETTANDIPYQDAVAAFEYYLEHYNQGKPFILTGHSQGSIVLKQILQEYLKHHPDVLKRMVVAYPLGYSYETSYFERNPHLKFAEGETDTGVIATWNCERLENGEFGDHNNVCFPGALSINPVTWTHDYERAEADDPRFLDSKNYPDLRCSAQVQYDPVRDYEVLILGIDSDEYDLDIIGDQNLHRLDYSLFTENLKENAQKRINAFKNKK